MNELPRTINGATLPEGECWFNPQNLDLERFGPDHRPMTKTEWERTDAGLTVEVWSDSLSGVWIPKPFLQYRYLTYRLPSATPFLMPEKHEPFAAEKAAFAAGKVIQFRILPGGDWI